MDNLFQAFRFADIQRCLTIKHVLDRHSIEWEDFELWVKRRATSPTQTIIPKSKKKKGCSGCGSPTPHMLRGCLDCDTPMLQFSVNTVPCDQVGGSLTRQWICPKCEWEDFE